MSKQRLGPEAKIINLFAALPEDSRRIVLDVIKSQSTTPRKAASKKPAGATQGAKEPTVEKKSDACCVAMVPTLNVVCGEREEALIHDPAAGYGGQHVFDPGKPVARAPRKLKLKTPDPQSDPNTAGATESAIAASSAGD
jgi:hypothetical protein